VHLLFAQIATPDAVKPALTLLDSSVLGAVLVVALVVATGAITALVRVQNARVADQKALSDKSEALMNKMITAFTDMRGTLESLKAVLDSLKDSEQETQKVLNAQQRSFELTLLMRGVEQPRGSNNPPDPIKRGRG
jgi:hypothetical protein